MSGAGDSTAIRIRDPSRRKRDCGNCVFHAETIKWALGMTEGEVATLPDANFAAE